VNVWAVIDQEKFTALCAGLKGLEGKNSRELFTRQMASVARLMVVAGRYPRATIRSLE
jgi:hypothetical protein